MAKRSEKLQADTLALLKAERRPLSAYDILEALRSDERRLAPITIYRALSALVETGAVHRIESQNAFVACQTACGDCASIMSICDHCGAVEETASRDVLTALSKAIGANGFAATRHVIEVLGRCAACGSAGEQPR